MTDCLHCSSGRRDFIKIAFGGAAAAALSGKFFLPSYAASTPAKAKCIILLWMQGGPSQLDTFDPKPGAETGGPFKAIDSKMPGAKLSEHLPRLAASAKLSLVRTVHSKDPNHDTARYLLHTGYRVDSTVDHPHLGSLISKELGVREGGLPGCITIGNGDVNVGAGYLSPDLAPLLVEKIDAPLE